MSNSETFEARLREELMFLEKDKWYARTDDTAVSRFVDLSVHDEWANDTVKWAAIEAGEPKPQGFCEHLAANWQSATQFQPWVATRRGQQRFGEAQAEQARLGALAYVFGNGVGVPNAYTRFLIDRYGPYNRNSSLRAQYGAGTGLGKPSSIGGFLIAIAVGGLAIAANVNAWIGIFMIVVVILYATDGFNRESFKQHRLAFEQKLAAVENDVGPAFGALLGLAVALFPIAVAAWYRSHPPPNKSGEEVLGVTAVLTAAGFVCLAVYAYLQLMNALKGRGVGGHRCIATRATAPEDALRLWPLNETVEYREAYGNPFGPKRFEFRFPEAHAERPLAGIASWLADQFSHTSTGASWKVISTPKSVRENEITFTANVSYSCDSESYLARSGGSTVRVQSVTEKQSGGQGAIHLQATVVRRDGPEIFLTFTETTYPMWLRRQSEAVVARTLIELQAALQETYPSAATRYGGTVPPADSFRFRRGDWATWQVVEVPGHGLVELAPQ